VHPDLQKLLELPIAEFPLTRSNGDDLWTIEDILKGVLIFGGTGSGKTSGSGQFLARALLYRGFGGLVLTVKQEECDLWQEYARDLGRESDIIVVDSSAKQRFNFVDYEVNRGGAGEGLTDNVYQIFKEITGLISRTAQRGGDPFWEEAAERLFKHTVDVLTFAGQRLSVEDISSFVTSAPQTPMQVQAFDSDTGLCAKSFQQAKKMLKANLWLAKTDKAHDVEVARRFFLEDFATMADKTRSSITATFSTMLAPLMRGLTRTLLCTDTTLTPEKSFEGKIIVVNLPVNSYHTAGKTVQIVWKYLWQQAVRRRTITPTSRGVFLWADECQEVVSPTDRAFLNLERSYLASTIYLTQNVHNLYDALGKTNADALLGSFQNFLFHANSDHATNEWAASQVSRDWANTLTYSTPQGSVTPSDGSTSIGEAYRYKVEPHKFLTLKNGGARNDYEVEGILLRPSKPWQETNDLYRYVSFDQRG
jgi:type IV secretory pathway TraG/TraD family ATPase VirD4